LRRFAVAGFAGKAFLRSRSPPRRRHLFLGKTQRTVISSSAVPSIRLAVGAPHRGGWSGGRELLPLHHTLRFRVRALVFLLSPDRINMSAEDQPACRVVRSFRDWKYLVRSNPLFDEAWTFSCGQLALGRPIARPVPDPSTTSASACPSPPTVQVLSPTCLRETRSGTRPLLPPSPHIRRRPSRVTTVRSLFHPGKASGRDRRFRWEVDGEAIGRQLLQPTRMDPETQGAMEEAWKRGKVHESTQQAGERSEDQGRRRAVEGDGTIHA